MDAGNKTPRVIGAGFGRTGTSSMKLALQMLGFGPCHHMEEVIKNPAEVSTWEAAARGESVDWKRFLSGWGSTVDFPSSFYYQELAAAFPDAKVILTVRDGGGWYDSFSTTILPMITGFPSRVVGPWLPYASGPFRSTGKVMLDRIFGSGGIHDRETAIAAFNRHNEEVKATIPAERLLVFDVREGWGPLCAFLDVPVPTEPFPKVNDAREFQTRTTRMQILGWGLLATPPLFAALAAASYFQRSGAPILKDASAR